MWEACGCPFALILKDQNHILGRYKHTKIGDIVHLLSKRQMPPFTKIHSLSLKHVS